MYASTEQRSRERVQVLADRLYRERYPYLLRIALKNAANPDDAEEAVNEAFAAFLRAFDLAGQAPPLAWLALALKRECWAKYRHEHFDRRTEKQPEVDFGKPGLSIESNRTSAAGPEESIERTERIAEARAQLAALKPAERRAVGLIAAGYSYREIGEITGWSYTKINRCASEGRARLREQVA